MNCRQLMIICFCMLITLPAYSLDNTKVATIAQVAIDVEQDSSTIPGAITAIADDSGTLWQGVSNCDDKYETSGLKCPGTTVSVANQVRIGSETKTYTGTVILKMIDDGVLNLEDKLSAWLPSLKIPNSDQITIKNLLQMTSTIPDYLSAPALPAFGGTGTINDQYVRAYGKLDITPPDTYIMATNSMSRTSGMSYSNTNFAILALIAEKASCSMNGGCQTIEQLIQQYVAGPLLMESTLLPTDDQFTQANNTGYVMVIAGDPITGTASLENENANKYLDDFTFLSPSLPWSAGAMIATLDDQIIWARQLVKNNQNLLTPTTQDQRLNDTVPGSVAGIPANYGLAIYHMQSDYNGSHFTGHSGDIYGFTSSLFYSEDTQLYYSVYVNQAPATKTSRNFLWDVEKGIRFLQDQNGNCQGEPQPMPSECTGMSVRTSSLTIPTGASLTIKPSDKIYNGYNSSDCSTNATTGATTCPAVQNTAPTLAFYGHGLEGIQIDSGELTLESGALLQCSGRNCVAIATTGTPVLNINGTIVTEGTGSKAISGDSQGETVKINAGASVTGDIDLGDGENTIHLDKSAAFSGDVVLSNRKIRLANIGGERSLTVSVKNNQVQVEDASGQFWVYNNHQWSQKLRAGTRSSTTVDDQTVSSDSFLVPIDIDFNGETDLVVYQDDDSSLMKLKIGSSLFKTSFGFPSESSGAFGSWMLLILISLVLLRLRHKNTIRFIKNKYAKLPLISNVY